LEALERLGAVRRFSADFLFALVRRFVAVRRLGVVRRLAVVRRFNGARFFRDERDAAARFLRFAICCLPSAADMLSKVRKCGQELGHNYVVGALDIVSGPTGRGIMNGAPLSDDAWAILRAPISDIQIRESGRDGAHPGYCMNVSLACVDGRIKSHHRRFLDALREGLQLRDQFPQRDVKVQSMKADGQQETASHRLGLGLAVV
jgi:hypothetical protein